MRRLAFLGLFLLSSSTILSGCTALQSEVVKDMAKTPNGIPYFLPRRPFVITVSVPTGGGLPNITVSSGSAEPDLAQEFVLSAGTNLLAQNEFNVTVGPTGLLMSSESTATSEVGTAVQNAAATVAMLATPVPSAPGGQLFTQQSHAVTNAMEKILVAQAGAGQLPGPKIACPPSGTSLQYIVYPEVRFATAIQFCAETGTTYSVTWERSDDLQKGQISGKPFGTSNSNLDTGRRVSGLFFRHELPYVVRIAGTTAGHADANTLSEYVVSSPDESETAFFPVKRNFFANNTANITVTDGVITGVDQVTQSEVAALVGLPATYISNYMTAVGQLFSGLTSISSSQQKLLQQLQSTAVTQNQAAAVAAAQYQVCRKTVASFNFTNMSAAQASAAEAAIQAACTSSSNSQ